MASADKYRRPARKDGRVTTAWRARWVDGDGVPRSKAGFDRRADAERWAQDREAEQRHGLTLDTPASALTLRAWSVTWLSGLEVRPGTADSYRYALGRVLPSLGDRPLAALRPSELKSWRRALGDRYAERTAAHTASVLAMVLRAAVHDGLLERTPMPPGRGGRGGRVVDPDELLSLEQVRAWDAALPAHARGAVLVAAATGLRQGELLGLVGERVDWLRRQVRVEVQLQRGDLTPPKTAAGVRTVPLAEVAAQALSAHVAAHPSPAGEPVFLTSRGARWSRSGWQSVWRGAAVRAGMPGWAHFHSLRDVAASLLIREGVDVRAVATILGHANPTETLTVYARIWPDALDNARRSLDGAWGESENLSARTS